MGSIEYTFFNENLIPPEEPLMSLNPENNQTPLTPNIINQNNTPEDLSTPIIDVDEMKFTKKYFIKENLILYLIYWIIFLFYLYVLYKIKKFNGGIIIVGGILLLLIIICGFRELLYIITIDIKKRNIIREYYTINTLSLCYFFCYCCCKKEIDLRKVKYFWNINRSNLKGCLISYYFEYFYYLGALCKDNTNICLIKKGPTQINSGGLFIPCYIYHFFSRNRFNFDKLVIKLNTMLKTYDEYINSE